MSVTVILKMTACITLLTIKTLLLVLYTNNFVATANDQLFKGLGLDNVYIFYCSCVTVFIFLSVFWRINVFILGANCGVTGVLVLPSILH